MDKFLKEYQKFTQSTAIYPVIGHPIIYPILGLNGEVGELTEKVKKMFRDKNSKMEMTTLFDLSYELGDILWYISQICNELGVSLKSIFELNINKLRKRVENNTIKGSGDIR